MVAPQVKNRRWDDSCGTEGEEIPRPRKDSCCELVMDIISVKAGGEGGVTVTLTGQGHLYCAACLKYFTQDVPFIPPNDSSR